MRPVAFADPGHPIQQQSPTAAATRDRRFPHRCQNRNLLGGTAACVLVFAALAVSQGGAHSTGESRTCGCILWLPRTRRAVPLAPSVPPCGIARTSLGSIPTSPRFPNPTLPLEFLWLELGYILRVATASPRGTFCTARFAPEDRRGVGGIVRAPCPFRKNRCSPHFVGPLHPGAHDGAVEIAGL
jgi:hypothetical protein